MKTEEETQVITDDSLDTDKDVSGEPEVTVDSLTEEITRLKAEVEKSSKTAEKAQNDAKSHQKAALEAGRWKAKIDGIEAQIGVLAEILEERQPESEGYEVPKPKITFQERLKEKNKNQPDPQIVEADAHRKSVTQEIIALTDDKDMPFNKTPEFDRAYDKWTKGDEDYALELVKEITEKMTKAKEEPSEVDELKKKMESMEKELKIAKGELDAETGLPGGSTPNEAQIRKNYRESPEDPKAYRAYHDLMAREAGY